MRPGPLDPDLPPYTTRRLTRSAGHGRAWLFGTHRPSGKSALCRSRLAIRAKPMHGADWISCLTLSGQKSPTPGRVLGIAKKTAKLLLREKKGLSLQPSFALCSIGSRSSSREIRAGTTYPFLACRPYRPCRGRLGWHPLFLPPAPPDRKSTRLNSSHRTKSYAVFCL